MKETLAQMKQRALEIALTLPDEGNVEIIRVMPRHFELYIHPDGKFDVRKPVWTRTGKLARIERAIQENSQYRQKLK